MSEKHTGDYVAYLRAHGVNAETEFITQEKSVRKYLNGGDWKLLDIFKEKETGAGKTRRPQLVAAISLCTQKGATLLLAKLEHLAKDVSFVDKLLKSKVKFAALDLPMANDETISLICQMAEHEHNRLSRRTKDALAAVKAAGQKLGNPNPDAGLKLGRAMRTDQADKYAEKVYPIIQEIRRSGIVTLRAMADELMSRQVLTPLGKKNWGPEQVKKIIVRQQKAEKVHK